MAARFPFMDNKIGQMWWQYDATEDCYQKRTTGRTVEGLVTSLTEGNVS